MFMNPTNGPISGTLNVDIVTNSNQLWTGNREPTHSVVDSLFKHIGSLYELMLKHKNLENIYRILFWTPAATSFQKIMFHIVTQYQMYS